VEKKITGSKNESTDLGMSLERSGEVSQLPIRSRGEHKGESHTKHGKNRRRNIAILFNPILSKGKTFSTLNTDPIKTRWSELEKQLEIRVKYERQNSGRDKTYPKGRQETALNGSIRGKFKNLLSRHRTKEKKERTTRHRSRKLSRITLWRD